MEHQWRPMYPPPPPPPHQQGSFCPVCSISHFPFCPPPLPPHPAYDQNPRFPPPPHPDYPPPAPPPPPPPPDPYKSGTNYYNHNNNTNNYDYREGGYGQQQQMYDFYNSSSSSEVVDRRYKRARVDDHDHDCAISSFDNERRLKLIRNHGVSSANYTDYNSNNNSNIDFNSHQYSRNRDSGDFRLHDFNNHYQNHHHLQLQHHQQQQPTYGSSNNSYMRPIDCYNNSNNNANGQGGFLPPRDYRVIDVPPPPPPLLPPHPAEPLPMPPLPVEPPPLPPPAPSQASLFPVPVASSTTVPYLHNNPLSHASTALFPEELQTSSMPNKLSPDKPTVIDAFRLFKQPYRRTRPDRIVIILRGLPGSGKSYLAKMIRDLEVENGGNAPRIHSMDDYFMTEVEKVDESDALKSSSFVRGKKPIVKKVMEYCYEPEMEEAYRDSMLKAFRKTLEERIFTLVIVDDRNLRVADFSQFWAIAKRSGYEVYISEATYTDPVGCAARNVHGFTLDEIKTMAGQWEEAPILYLQLDIKSLFHGDDLKESGIQEVDMDTEDGNSDDNLSGLLERKVEKTGAPSMEDDAPQVPAKGLKRWDAEEDHPRGGVKELLKSKWSDDLDEDTERSTGMNHVNALSGLIQAYEKQGKSVRWSDQAGNIGFSIGAAKKSTKSLVIGPGAGYNLKSNPLCEERSPASAQIIGESRQGVFQERLRAERESFKAVFEKRRRRIGGLDLEEE